MDVGLLKKDVTFKVNTQVATGTGGFTDSYSDLLTTKGYLQKKNRGTRLETGEIVVTNAWELTVRYQSSIESNLSQSMIVEIDSRLFSVSGWEKLNERNFYYVINLYEKNV